MKSKKDKIDKLNILNVTKEDLNKILKLMVSAKKKFKFSCMGKSMFPFFYNCNLIKIEPISFKSVKIGDVIFYYNKDSNLIAHRVIKKNRENGQLMLITKGDFVSFIDEPVCEKDFIGKVVAVYSKNRFVPPFLGTNRYLGPMIAKISIVSCYIWPFLKLVKRVYFIIKSRFIFHFLLAKK